LRRTTGNRYALSVEREQRTTKLKRFTTHTSIIDLIDRQLVSRLESMVYYNYYQYYDDDNWDEGDHKPAFLLAVIAFFSFWFQATVTEEVSSRCFLLHKPSRAFIHLVV
jgi:hypothetical protein